MKKMLAFLLIVSLVLVIALTSCKKEPTPEDTTAAPAETTTEMPKTTALPTDGDNDVTWPADWS